VRALFVQFSNASSPADWVAYDLFAGDVIPAGNVIAAAYMGMSFDGFDRIFVDTDGDDLIVVGLCDDPVSWSTNRWARVVRLPPLAADPDLGGAINTQGITETVYAEGDSVAMLKDYWGDPLPFDDLPALEGVELPGELLSDEDYAAHIAARSSISWRMWSYGVDPAWVDENGSVIEMRPVGLWAPPDGTRTYYQRDIAQPAGAFAADFENAMLRDNPGSGETQTAATGAAGDEGWAFTTVLGEPNLLSWPNGVYRCQMDVSALGANVVFGLLNLGAGADGHFGRILQDLSATVETHPQDQAVFTTPGIHLATYTGGFADANESDRFSAVIAIDRISGGMGTQTIELTFDADAFIDAPFPASNAPAAIGLIEGIVELLSEVSS